jgi:hypothetical protein
MERVWQMPLFISQFISHSTAQGGGPQCIGNSRRSQRRRSTRCKCHRYESHYRLYAEHNAEDDGTFTLSNIPSNQYDLEISASGFAIFTQGVTERSSLQVQLPAKLSLSSAQEVANVEAGGLGFSKLIPRLTSMLIGELSPGMPTKPAMLSRLI